jgi:hypothetical protein
VLFNIANTSQGRMVGDYISTSFNSSGLAATVFAVGVPPTGPQAFDEAMYAPTTPLAVTSAAAATRAASSSGVQSTGGTGQGALLRSIRHN